MDFNEGTWIRIFDITDTAKHHKGFIIYKVISMLYPEKCPDAVTRLIVWKRYNDFKKLHKDMKNLHDKYNIADRFPAISRGTFFKKYDKQALLEKKQSALHLLEFIGNHHQLFTSTEFVKFFESSYTPSDHLNGNINSIKADLKLPDDPQFMRYSEDETVSDTDSVCTASSLASPNDHIDHPANLSGHPSRQGSLRSAGIEQSRSFDNSSIYSIESLTLLDGQIYSSPPRSHSYDELYMQYIIDASVHIKLAEELENDKKYEEAFTAYKTAIDILLIHGKNEENYDRKRLVKYKTEKYILRAEKLYNMYLAPEVKKLHAICQETEEKHDEVQKPVMSNLYKYNVIRIIDSGMLVVHSDTQSIFYVKVIHKTTKFLNENLILPENVPYMVRLYNYFNCDNALFLVLEYVDGLKMLDYLKNIKENSDQIDPVENVMEQVANAEISDEESEKSFSDLISDYTKSKTGNSDDSDDSFEKINIEDILTNQSKNILDQPIPKDFSIKLEYFPNFESPSKNQPDKIYHRMNSTFSHLSVEVENADIPDTKITVKWAAQLILALEKLHILGVTCKRLRSSHLIIDENGDLRLTFMCNLKELCDVFDKKNLNLAPEVHGIGPVGQEADWWSLGVILYEILVGAELGDFHPQYFSASTILKVPKYVSPEGRSLLRQLLVHEPKERLGSGPHGIDNLKSHPFFRDVNWNMLLERSIRQ